MNVPVNAADQARQASQTGDVLKPKYQQVAGAGSGIIKLLNRLGAISTKPYEAVPTPRTERLEPGVNYQRRQQEVAEQVLSPEGKARFDAAGRDARAVQSEEATILDTARKSLTQDAAGNVPTDPAQKTLAPEWQMEEVLTAQDRAKQAIKLGKDGEIEDFNYDNLATGDDVKALITAVSEVDEAATIAAKRGVQTNVQTTEEARQLLSDEFGTTRRILNRSIGQTMNAAEMTAARSIMTKSSEKLDSLAKQIVDLERSGSIDSSLLLRFRRQLAIHAGVQMQVKGAQTEIARALQAFRIPVGSDMGPELTSDILNGHGGIGEAIKLAKGYRKSVEKGGRVAGNKFARGGFLSGANSVFQEVYVNGLLSWINTQYKNLFSTPSFMMMRGAEDLLAGLYGTLYRSGLRAAGKEVNPEGAYISDIAARFYGNSRAFSNAMSIAADVWRTELPSDALSKLDANQYRAIDAERLGLTGIWGKATDALGKVIRIPQRALLSVDEFWKATSDTGELYVQSLHAMRRAKAAGKTDQEAMDDALMVAIDPRAVGKEMDTAARYATLTTDLAEHGPLIAAMGKFVGEAQRNPFGRMIVPFITVPTNDVIRVLERTPAAFIMRKPLADMLGKNGPEAAQKALARFSLGTASLYGVYQMALDGRITGNLPADRKEREALRLGHPNFKPYSLVFRGENWPVDEDGDELPLYNARTGLPNGPLEYVPYGGYGPVAGLMAIGASIAERMRITEDPDQRSSIVANGVAATFGYFSNMPFLMGVANVYKAIDYDDPGYVLDAPIGASMPFSSLGRNIMTGFDTTLRKASQSYDLYTAKDVEAMPKKSGRFQYNLVGLSKGILDSDVAARGMMDEWWQLFTKDSSVAGAFGYRDTETLATQYDVLGREIDRGVRFDVNPKLALWNLFSPLKFIPGEKPGGVEKELVRLGVPLSRKRTGIQIGSRRIGLTEKQQSDWVNLAKNEVVLLSDVKRDGKKVYESNMPFYAALGTLMGKPHYARADAVGKINLIRNMEQRFYKAALPRLLNLPGNQNLRQVVAERKFLLKQKAIR